MGDTNSVLNFPVLNPYYGILSSKIKEDTTNASVTLFQVMFPIAVKMPNRNGYVPDPRPDVPTKETS